MFPIFFSFALTLAGMDAGGIMYDPPQDIEPGIIYMQSLEARVSIGPLFVDGEAIIYDWKSMGELSWWPNRLGSTFSAGLDFDWLEVGYSHRCDHPVTPWESFQVTPPKWEGWSDMLYIRIEGKVRLR